MFGTLAIQRLLSFRTGKRAPTPLELQALVRQRRQLVDLDDHLLDDIGLNRADAENEAARPIWDVPSHWRR